MQFYVTQKYIVFHYSVISNDKRFQCMNAAVGLALSSPAVPLLWVNESGGDHKGQAVARMFAKNTTSSSNRVWWYCLTLKADRGGKNTQFSSITGRYRIATPTHGEADAASRLVGLNLQEQTERRETARPIQFKDDEVHTVASNLFAQAHDAAAMCRQFWRTRDGYAQ